MTIFIISMKLIDFLNKPFPAPLNKWSIVIWVSIFIGLFIYLFQPFGLQAFETDYKSIILLGYGLVTFLFLCLFLIIIPLLFKSFFREENWKVWKEMFWLTIILIGIAFGNYFYSVVFNVFGWMGWNGLLTFLSYTLPIALIPASIVTIIQQNVSLKRNIRSSSVINDKIQSKEKEQERSGDEITIKSEQGDYIFELNGILYMNSEGNYVKVVFQKEGVEQSEMIRITLKNMLIQLMNTPLIQCHRAYIVNLNRVSKVSGNSQGYLLSFEYTHQTVPVSRSFIKAFNSVFIAGN